MKTCFYQACNLKRVVWNSIIKYQQYIKHINIISDFACIKRGDYGLDQTYSSKSSDTVSYKIQVT